MKDLYRRNNLEPLESNFVKIHTCKSEDPEDNEAAFAILLNKERKQQYDKVYKTLNQIGRLRRHFKLSDVDGWSGKYADFVDPSPIGEKFAARHGSTDKNESGEGKKSIPKRVYYAAAGAVLLVVIIAGMLKAPPQENTGDEVVSGDGTTLLKHALSANTPIRNAPAETGNIVAELGLFDDIHVLRGASNDGWEITTYNGRKSYVLSKNLANGSGYLSYLRQCQSPPTARPVHGEALFNARSGPHSLLIVNPPGQDAVVKLKDRRNQDVLTYYVHGGKSLNLETIPEGIYSLWYAVGDNYNAGCGHFLDNARAWRENDSVDFRLNAENDMQYTTSHLLSLKNPLSDARPVDLRYF